MQARRGGSIGDTGDCRRYHPPMSHSVNLVKKWHIVWSLVYSEVCCCDSFTVVVTRLNGPGAVNEAITVAIGQNQGALTAIIALLSTAYVSNGM